MELQGVTCDGEDGGTEMLAGRAVVWCIYSVASGRRHNRCPGHLSLRRAAGDTEGVALLGAKRLWPFVILVQAYSKRLSSPSVPLIRSRKFRCSIRLSVLRRTCFVVVLNSRGHQKTCKLFSKCHGVFFSPFCLKISDSCRPRGAIHSCLIFVSAETSVQLKVMPLDNRLLRLQ